MKLDLKQEERAEVLAEVQRLKAEASRMVGCICICYIFFGFPLVAFASATFPLDWAAFAFSIKIILIRMVGCICICYKHDHFFWIFEGSIIHP